MDCIKGKQTNKFKEVAKRSDDILEVIHSNICCPECIGPKYLIFIIYDCSCYIYLYKLHNKDEASDSFKVFKVEVEKQCIKQIKVVRTNRAGVYYGKYTEDG